MMRRVRFLEKFKRYGPVQIPEARPWHFRHSAQLENESVADFIRGLEKTFQIAYGRDKLKTET